MRVWIAPILVCLAVHGFGEGAHSEDEDAMHRIDFSVERTVTS